jgi:hypothetical protein
MSGRGGVNTGCYVLLLCYFLSLLRAGPSMSPITCTTTTIWNTVRSARIKKKKKKKKGDETQYLYAVSPTNL